MTPGVKAGFVKGTKLKFPYKAVRALQSFSLQFIARTSSTRF